MTFNAEGFGPGELFDIDKELDDLNKFLDNFSMLRDEIDDKHRDRIDFLQEKIHDLYKQIEIVKAKRQEEQIKLRDKKFDAWKKKEALIEAKKRQELNEQYDKIVDTIKEIVQEFAAWSKAREYQMEDVISVVHQFIIGDSGILNANEMALGKTFESIVSLFILRELFKRKFDRNPTILWLTKSSIVKTGGTIAEFERWYPEFKMISLDGNEKPALREFTAKLAAKGEMGLLTNYEVVRTTENIRKMQWDIIIMDEVHKLKGGANASGSTAVWKSVRELRDKSTFILMLTGTPLVNKAEEMWSYLHIFDPAVFPNARDFTKKFTGFKSAAGEFKMSIDADKLFQDVMKGRMIRRTAEEVGLQLPQVIRQDVPVELEGLQRQYYNEIREKFFIWLEETQKPLTTNNILTQLLRLRQIAVLPVVNFKIRDDEGNVVEEFKLDCKESAKLDAIELMLLEHNRQAVGFCNFNEPMWELQSRLKKMGKTCEVIASETSNKMGNYERDFQQGLIDVLLINIQMGEGLNLHRDPEKWPGGAGVGFTIDRWWNNAKNDQCFKRVVRPGSPGPVFFYDYYVEHSVDDYIKLLCDAKDAEFRNLTEHEDARPRDEVKELLSRLL